MTDIPKELKDLRYDQDLTQEQAAEMCDVSVGTWQSWEQGRHTPNAAKLDYVRSTLDARNKSAKKHVQKDRESQTTLPLLSVSAEAGSSCNLWQTAIRSYMSVDRSVISTETGADPDRLAVVPVSGNSMEPTISAGDRVVVVRRGREPSIIEGCVYIWRSSRRGVILKRASWEDSTTLILISDNDRYADIRLDWETQGAWECLGQVVRVMSAV
jgi:phage repressor protein C with HTH and peptisase S24 domain